MKNCQKLETRNNKQEAGTSGLEFKVSSLKLKVGFSLIELLIVITLFAITTIAITISFISFEGKEQVKNAALSLKSDLRLAQNSAQNGDIVDPVSCPRDSAHHLYGWYVYLDTAFPSSYVVGGDCLTDPSAETPIGVKTVNLPSGVSVCSVSYNSVQITNAVVLFKPLSYTAYFANETTLGVTPPDFLDDTNPVPIVRATLAGANPDELIITVSSADGFYEVHVTASGDIYEKQVGVAASCT